MIIRLQEYAKDQLITFLKLVGKNKTKRFQVHIQGEHQVSFGIMGIGNYSITHLMLTKGQVLVENLEPVFLENPFELDVKDVETMLSYSKRKDVILSPEIVNGELEGFNVTITNPENGEIDKQIEIPCFIKEMVMKIPKLHYDECTKIIIPIKTMTDILSEVSEYGSMLMLMELVVENSRKRLAIVTTDSQNARKRIRLMKNPDKDFTLIKDDLCRCKFNIEFVSNNITIAQAGCYDALQITLGNKKPLVIEYLLQTATGSEPKEENIPNLTCYIAPALDQGQ